MADLKTFLSNNRNLVIKVYNVNAKSNTDLKTFMTYIVNNYEGELNEDVLRDNLIKALTFFKVEPTKGEVEVRYTKPYSESKHAKMVALYGKEKVEQFARI